MVGDESPQVSCISAVSSGFETLEKIVEIQGFENWSVSHIQCAAMWLSHHRTDVVGAVIPFIRQRFGLTVLDAIEAAKLAHTIEYGARNG
jgi:hypothetical protein